MSDLDSLHYFFGILVPRNASGVFLSQVKYAYELLDCADMTSCKPSSTPIATSSKLPQDACSPIDDPTAYRSIAGALQYLTFTHVDIVYAVQQMCLHMHGPLDGHLQLVK